MEQVPITVFSSQSFAGQAAAVGAAAASLRRPDASRVAFEKLRDCAIENLCRRYRFSPYNLPHTGTPTCSSAIERARNSLPLTNVLIYRVIQQVSDLG